VRFPITLEETITLRKIDWDVTAKVKDCPKMELLAQKKSWSKIFLCSSCQSFRGLVEDSGAPLEVIQKRTGNFMVRADKIRCAEVDVPANGKTITSEEEEKEAITEGHLPDGKKK